MSKYDVFDYEEVIPAIREAYVTRNLEVNRTPELEELAAEFEIPLPTVNRFFLSEDWEGQRRQAVTDFTESFTAIRRQEIDKRSLVMMNEIGRLTKQNVDFLAKTKPIIFARIEALLNSEIPLKPETLIRLLEMMLKVETSVVDLAIKIKNQLDHPEGEEGGSTGKADMGDLVRLCMKVLVQKEETVAEKQLFAKLDAE